MGFLQCSLFCIETLLFWLFRSFYHLLKQVFFWRLVAFELIDLFRVAMGHQVTLRRLLQIGSQQLNEILTLLRMYNRMHINTFDSFYVQSKYLPRCLEENVASRNVIDV